MINQIQKNSFQVSIDKSFHFFTVGSNLELISSPTTYGPLQGEVNLVRYLSRVGPNDFNYELVESSVNETDSTLDMCYLLVNAKDNRERQKQLRLLNSRLGKQQYFGGNNATITDIAVSSSVKQLNIIKELTPAMKLWLNRLTSTFGY